MARHDQYLTPHDFVCTSCKDDNCRKCVDQLRITVGYIKPLCYCKRKTHSRGKIMDEATITEVTCYQYRDADLNVIWNTSVPRDDEAALRYFHTIMLFGEGFMPVYVERKVKTEAGDRYQMLPWLFDPESMTTRRR